MPRFPQRLCRATARAWLPDFAQKPYGPSSLRHECCRRTTPALSRFVALQVAIGEYDAELGAQQAEVDAAATAHAELLANIQVRGSRHLTAVGFGVQGSCAAD